MSKTLEDLEIIEAKIPLSHRIYKKLNIVPQSVVLTYFSKVPGATSRCSSFVERFLGPSYNFWHEYDRGMIGASQFQRYFFTLQRICEESKRIAMYASYFPNSKTKPEFNITKEPQQLNLLQDSNQLRFDF